MRTDSTSLSILSTLHCHCRRFGSTTWPMKEYRSTNFCGQHWTYSGKLMAWLNVHTSMPLVTGVLSASAARAKLTPRQLPLDVPMRDPLMDERPAHIDPIHRHV